VKVLAVILRRQLPIILGIVVYSGVVTIRTGVGQGLFTFVIFSVVLLPVTLFLDRKVIQLTFRELKERQVYK
jgi:hypothetical protein